MELTQDGLDFRTGKDDGHGAMPFGANGVVHFPEFPAEDVPEEEEQGIECLVLAGGGDAVLDGKSREEAADLLGAEFASGSAVDEGLEFTRCLSKQETVSGGAPLSVALGRWLRLCQL